MFSVLLKLNYIFLIINFQIRILSFKKQATKLHLHYYTLQSFFIAFSLLSSISLSDKQKIFSSLQITTKLQKFQYPKTLKQTYTFRFSLCKDKVKLNSRAVPFSLFYLPILSDIIIKTQKNFQMGTCVLLCSRDISNSDNRERVYIEPEIPQKIADQLEKQTPTTNETQLQPLHQVVNTLSHSQPLKETKTQHKSRFYRKKLRHSETLRPSSSSNIKDEHSYRASKELIGHQSLKRARKQHFQDVQAKEISDQSNTDSIFQKQNSANISISIPLPPLSQSVTNQFSCTVNIDDHFQGATSEDDRLISQSFNFTKPTKIEQEIIFKNGARYIGQWMEGHKEGKGIMLYQDGSKYDGEWKKDKFNGKGLLTFANCQIYEGMFENGNAHGFGIFYFKNGSKYRGEWFQNKKQGQGIQQWRNGQRYIGKWQQGKKNGYGQLYFQDGSYYKGSFLNNELNGTGEYCWHSKRIYKGGWEHNQMSGQGILLWQNGNRYEGQFLHDKMNGNGKYISRDGIEFIGLWENGRKSGIIIEKRANGQIKKGEWYFGKLIKYLDERRVRSKKLIKPQQFQKEI